MTLTTPDPQKINTLAHCPEKQHPLRKLQLALFPISGRRSEVEEFVLKLKFSSSSHGAAFPENNKTCILNNGCISVVGKMTPFKPKLTFLLNILSHLFDKVLSYSSIDVARSALSAFINIISGTDLGKNILVSKFMKSVFNAKPAIPRYTDIWDVNTVLKYLSGLNTQTLLMLKAKLSMLFLLLSAQRCKTLHLICLEDIIPANKVYGTHMGPTWVSIWVPYGLPI